MNWFGSSLNPYAAPYIPLAEREANITFITENSSQEPYLHNPPFDNRSPRLNMHHDGNAPVSVASAVNNPPFHGSVSQHSNQMTEMLAFDRQFNLDLEFLQANFYDLSKQFLIDVYMANEGNLEAAADMLNQLKSEPPPGNDHAYQLLPDTLGIGVTLESVSAAVRRSSFEAKNRASNANTSYRF